MDFLPEGVAFNKDITYLAKTNFRAQEQVFGIKRKDRRQHMYVLGKSGSGKSALLGNMIVQNVWNGEGVCVVDPHGELVESILATIPAHRAKDVIYFNPADTDYHIGFNVLQIDDPKYKNLVASGLMGIFTKIWANAWSARMEYILNNAILALADTPGSTLLGIPRLLVDKDYRQVVINNLKDPVIKAFWVHEYENWRDQYRNEAIAPIQNKVGQFLSTSMVRNIVGQAKSTLDMFSLMNSGKIFLVNVSKGRIGEDNSALLGGMIITKLQLAAMERVRIPEEDRKDFYLYVDEFQNFVTDAFASILSEARKYRLNLTLAHQYIAQLVTKDSEAVRDAVFGNVGTMIIFRVGAADAEYLEAEFEPEFMIQDMVNLPNYTSYLKLMIDGVTSRPFSAKTLPPFKIPVNSNVANEIIETSRNLYARPREVVEREINDWSGMLVGLSEEGKFKAVCSSCGKDTTVPFEPEAGRPVYCKECIAKIKSGEMKPMKGATRARALEPQSYDALAFLGIEYESEKVQDAKAKIAVTPPRPASTVQSAPRPAPVRIPMPATLRPTPVEPVKPVVASPTAQAATTVAPKTEPTSPLPPSQSRPPRMMPPAVPRPSTPPISSLASTPTLTPRHASVVPPSPQPTAAGAFASVAPTPAREKNFRPAPRERKGPDHDGLQNILKEALGDVFDKNKIQPKPVEEKEAVATKDERPTMSLSSLKAPTSSTTVKMQSKTASDERVSALQNAIARAAAKDPAHTVTPAPAPIPVSVTPVAIPTPTTQETTEVSIPKKEIATTPSEASLTPSVPVATPTTAFVPRHTPSFSEPTPVDPIPVVESKPTEVTIPTPEISSKETPPVKNSVPASDEEIKAKESESGKKETSETKTEETPTPKSSTKTVREVPEDILRKVLND